MGIFLGRGGIHLSSPGPASISTFPSLELCGFESVFFLDFELDGPLGFDHVVVVFSLLVSQQRAIKISFRFWGVYFQAV